MTMNLAALRRIEVLESRLKPVQSIPDEDLPAAIQARLAPHLARSVTLAELAESDGPDAELARLLLAATRKMLEEPSS